MIVLAWDGQQKTRQRAKYERGQIAVPGNFPYNPGRNIANHVPEFEMRRIWQIDKALTTEAASAGRWHAE